MRKYLSIVFPFLAVFVLCFINSCSSVSHLPHGECSRNIDAKGIKNEDQLVCFFLAHNPDADEEKVSRLASFYKMECKYEGINSDVAFVQMCLETGFLRFGNLVTVDMNNFCGLGAINAENPGLSFETEQLGVKAHVQHLHAYGTDRELKGECIDPRYKYVKPRKKAPSVFELSGTWAADKEYGTKLDSLLDDLGAF
ncbi:MAG: glucosaminidase domain-containing protein [Treponemataceae bacterium]|nr:glucosaminidase domain-containing protein [Treponemataceae bacterium]